MKLKLLLRAQWDRIAGFGLLALGGVTLLVGYLRVSASAFVDQQLSYIASAGLGGVSLIAIGIWLLISADLHDEWRKLDRLQATLDGERRTSRPDTVADLQVSSARAGTPVQGSSPVSSMSASALSWTYPGARRSALLAVAAMCGGWLVTAAGWAKAARTADWNRGVEGVAIGLLGVAVVGIASGASTVRLRRRLVTRRNTLLQRCAPDGQSWPGGAALHDAQVFMVVANQTVYHRAGCTMLQGRAPVEVDPSDLDASLTPCGLCDAP